MRLAIITNWAYGATVFLTLASGTTMLMASGAQQDERAAVAQRYRLDQVTSAFGRNVTSLSDRAREYIITGDSSHLVLYRREAAALRPVEERIRTVKDIGAGPDELSALADAIRGADALQDEQRQAIEAGERGDKDQARRIPVRCGI